MGYKNREIEYYRRLDNKLGWTIFNKYSIELNKLIENNKIKTLNHIIIIISQINNKYFSALKSNCLTNLNTKYNNIWKSHFNQMYKVLKNKNFKYNLLIFNSKQLIYIGNKHLNSQN
tara:strand:+ start:135 stop:485 length:351 start_codon:yes stop_codon:yes gene_type:complete